MKPDLERTSWDVVVVGAGPAGSMTAHQLAQAGASVLLVDRQRFPRWKVCGACLSPGTQSVLRDAGLGRVLDDNHPVRLHTLRLAGWGTGASIPLGSSVALSRWALDRDLAACAVDAGAVLLTECRARPGPPEGARRTVYLERAGTTTPVHATIVVAADGLGSPFLSRAEDAPGSHVAPASRIGFGGVFSLDVAQESVESYAPGVIHMAVGRGGYVGLVRQEDGSLDVAAALSADDLGEEPPLNAVTRLLREAPFPSLTGEPSTGWKGTPKLTRHLTSLGAQRIFAVGDSAGYVEPFTGEGIAWALSGARLLTPLVLDALHGWSPDLLQAWNETHGATVGRAARTCRRISWALRRPSISRAGLHLLHHLPHAARPVVRHLAQAPLARAGATA